MSIDLSKQDLEDIAAALDRATRQVNIFSSAAGRWIELEQRVRDELRKKEVGG